MARQRSRDARTRCSMLGAALAAYDKKVAAGEAAPPPPPPIPDITQGMGGLHVSFGAGPHTSLMSQSLPSGGKLSFMGKPPPQPRVRPAVPSGGLLSELPDLELPEPSPHSNSLLSTGAGRLAGLQESGEEEEEEEEGGTSMLDIPRTRTTFEYAASAPATILWGPMGHRPASSSMGGRTPSKTLLAALSDE